MREAGIQAKSQRKFRVTTTDSNHTQPVAENVLNNLPKSIQPNAKAKLHEIWMAPTRAESYCQMLWTR